ncbi:hypothetical protein [Bdellovibrio sp. GT3]|uniref:hypothetical protein n=1 Tax=Bdellovibrio sp. GT3 TaxID=3136282 RepID=UPI0030F23A4B
MNKKIFVTVIVVGSMAHAQGYKCFQKVSETERREIVAKFMAKEYPEFKKKFADFCKKYSETVSCKTETVSLKKAPQHMSGIARQSPCAEVMRIDSGNDTTIYSMDDKTAPKRM